MQQGPLEIKFLADITFDCYISTETYQDYLNKLKQISEERALQQSEEIGNTTFPALSFPEPGSPKTMVYPTPPSVCFPYPRSIASLPSKHTARLPNPSPISKLTSLRSLRTPLYCSPAKKEKGFRSHHHLPKPRRLHRAATSLSSLPIRSVPDYQALLTSKFATLTTKAYFQSPSAVPLPNMRRQKRVDTPRKPRSNNSYLVHYKSTLSQTRLMLPIPEVPSNLEKFECCPSNKTVATRA